jgi:hypothetical protein
MRYGMTRRGIVTSIAVGVFGGFGAGMIVSGGSIPVAILTAVLAPIGVLSVYVNACYSESVGILRGRKRTRR